MKSLLVLAITLMLALQAFSQKRISCRYTAINKAQYDSLVRTPYLVLNPQIKKQPGRLIVPVAGQKFILFSDVNVDSEFAEYSYVGDIRSLPLSLIRKKRSETEDFYLVNHSTGAVDTLIGLPVFASNMEDFACLNNPGTDEQQQIQICALKNNRVYTKVYVKGKEDTVLNGIAYTGKNVLLTRDDHGKYWKLDLATGKE
jgi:hypothetical protein